MKKLFLQSGKLMYGEFPEEPESGGAMPAYDRAVSAAKASAVEVVNGEDCFHKINDWFTPLPGGGLGRKLLEGQLCDLPEGWTVEIEYQHKAFDTWETVDEKRYNQFCIIRAGVNRKVARLIPVSAENAQPSGIAAVGVLQYGKGWEGEKFSLLRDQETIASDRTETAHDHEFYLDNESKVYACECGLIEISGKTYYPQEGIVSPPPQAESTDCWMDIYLDFKDGEGWKSFAKRMNEKFTITRKP